MSDEIWKPIEGFEGLYEVSNFGRVKSLERNVRAGRNYGLKTLKERILIPHTQKTGRLLVVLCKDGKIYARTIHRLVAIAFIQNPENKPVVDHIDTNPANNRVDNLRWCTQKENCNNEISRKHNSESKKGHPCYYKGHSEETRRKISESHKGKRLSEEHKRSLSESHKGIFLGKPNELLKGKHWKVEGGKRVWY